MDRRDFLRAGLSSVALWALASRLPAAAARRRPNIVILISDDQGYHDLSLHGSKDLATPNIDAIGRNGVRCSCAYVPAAVCSPSRAGLLTGRYPQRWGQYDNSGGGLPASEVTLAEVLKTQGYATGMVGKWHLGGGGQHPLSQGFDEAHCLQWVDMVGKGRAATQPDPQPRVATPPMPADGDPEVEKYEAIRRSRVAADFIRRHREEPFFLYVAYFSPHQPYNPPASYLKRMAEMPPDGKPERRAYLASIAAMDDGVGMILKQLRESGLERDTLVIFVTDNGGDAYTPQSPADNGPLRAGKRSLYKGGIRVPLLAQWPGVIPAGSVCRVPVSTLDLLPTAVAATGGRTPPKLMLDGVNILPQLKGESGVLDRYLFWKGGKAGAAVRRGDWKLCRRDARGGARTELYNLARDPGEKTDLSGQEPEVVKDLLAALVRWEQELAPPSPASSGEEPTEKG